MPKTMQPPPSIRAGQEPRGMIHAEAVPVRWIRAAAGEGAAKSPTFEMVAYNGGLLRVANYWYPVVVDLAGLKAAGEEIPALMDHDATQRVGHGAPVISAQRIKMSGYVSGGGDAADEVRKSAQNDPPYPWKASIGVDPEPARLEWVDQGASAKANGKTFQGPCYIVREGVLQEISFLAIGADGKTSVSVAAGAAPNSGVPQMNEFEKWVRAQGFDPATLTDQQRVALEATHKTVLAAAAASANPPAPPAGAPPAAPPAPLQAGGNVDHAAQFRAQMAAEGLRVDQVRAAFAGEFPEICAEAIRDNWSLDRVQGALKVQRELKTLRAGLAGGPAIHGDSGQVDAAERFQTVCAALCVSGGIAEARVGKWFSEKVMNAALERRNRGLTLHYVMDQTLLAGGEYFAGSRKSDDYIRATLDAERSLRASGRLRGSAAFSTLSLSGVLSNVANKAMLASYESAETVWPLIAAMRSHTDFKAVTRFRLDASGAFRRVGPDGELKHVGLTEGQFSNQLDTFGAIIGLTRQMQINDDLGAFLQIPTMLGMMSAVAIEEELFRLLLANAAAFFHANNKNLISGAGTALSIDALSAAEQKFRDQVDSNAKPILVSPQILLVGTALKVLADKLYNESAVNETTTADKASVAVNPHAGKYKPVCSPYLNNTAIKDRDGKALTGQSATQWYLFANPAVRAALAVATLNGRTVPVIEASDAEFNVLGMQWRAYHDFGVGLEEPVAAVKSAGA